jgi:predicted Co/Zn/Cd cation transporter (cation efflux family)
VPRLFAGAGLARELAFGIGFGLVSVVGCVAFVLLAQRERRATRNEALTDEELTATVVHALVLNQTLSAAFVKALASHSVAGPRNDCSRLRRG